METIPSLIADLKKCGRSGDLSRGKSIHATAIQRRLLGNLRLANTLVDMYAKCGCLSEAQSLFDAMRHRSVVSWNVLISGYAENGKEYQALFLLSDMMRTECCKPGAVTFVVALKACSNLATKEASHKSLEMCMSLHSLAVENSGCMNMFVSNSLINIYAKCGSMADAQLVFEQMQERDVVSWNALLQGYVQNGEEKLALDLLSSMSCRPDALTFVVALKACSSDLALLVQVHWQALQSDCASDVRVANTLIDMYSNYGSLIDAQKVFDGMPTRTVVSWNVLISGYAENGEGKAALELLSRMSPETPDSLTFVAALKACTSMAVTEKGETVDGKLVKLDSKAKGIALEKAAVERGCVSDFRVANGLISMYAKCGCMTEARRIFDRARNRDVYFWSAFILGYAENGEGEAALEMFSLMKREGPAPDSVTFIAALKACGMVGALDTGRAIHADVCALGYENDPLLVTSLLDFYGKCGCMDEAQQLFDASSAKRDLITWNAILAGYSRNGDSARVFETFSRMKAQRFKPNGVSFLCVLTACSHAGLVDKGKEHFKEMTSQHKIRPDIEHYHCMIDMLGRANELKAALAMVESMPYDPDVISWMTLLAACKKWKNLEIGKVAFEALDEKEPAAYLSMASIYRSKGMMQEAAQLQKLEMQQVLTPNRLEQLPS